ncbi:hypothetical protein BLSTO_03582 [Blastocystis sp. subtype 1]
MNLFLLICAVALPILLWRRANPLPILRVVRRQERWADKKYKKGHNISSIKANVLGGATMAKGIVLEKVYVHPFLFQSLVVWRPSSPTPLFVSASVCSSSRTARRSLPSCLVMVA